MDDCKSFRSYQMLGSISDGVFFIRRGNDNDADDSLWTIFQVLGTGSPNQWRTSFSGSQHCFANFLYCRRTGTATRLRCMPMASGQYQCQDGQKFFLPLRFSKIFVGSSCHSAAGMSHRTHGNLLKIVAFSCSCLHY